MVVLKKVNYFLKVVKVGLIFLANSNNKEEKEYKSYIQTTLYEFPY